MRGQNIDKKIGQASDKIKKVKVATVNAAELQQRPVRSDIHFALHEDQIRFLVNDWENVSKLFKVTFDTFQLKSHI